MFSPQVFWRIENLIKTLTKKNNKTHTAELQELTKMFDTSSKAFLISSLLEEIDFKDQRTVGHKDTQKVTEKPIANIFINFRVVRKHLQPINHGFLIPLTNICLQINALQDAITKGLKEPNFASYLCQAFETYSNEKRLPQQQKLPDDIISTVCKALKLSTIQTVAIGFALLDWHHSEAKKFLRAKLPEILPGASLSEVHDDFLHGLYLLTFSSEVRETWEYLLYSFRSNCRIIRYLVRLLLTCIILYLTHTLAPAHRNYHLLKCLVHSSP
jgi:hypothetical protein